MGTPSFDILIGGEAGQGLVTVSELLTRSLVRTGYRVVVTQSYQSRIRGGHNTYAIRVSRSPVAAPREGVDLLVALNEETVSLHRGELRQGGLAVVDEGFDPGGAPSLKVPYERLAAGRFTNVAALGVTACLLGIDEEIVRRSVEERFESKSPESAEKNRQTLESAYSWTSARSVQLRRPDPADPADSRRLMLNGNGSIALGAISAGVKFCSFYPMTPSTSIPLTLNACADDMGLVVEQAEDEIAAVNMAVGASFAGAPSMVATSGGGFALMTEGVSLAGMTETPVVVVVAQRPGPATGLPTRTEQGDLEFVLRAGHGEFPRVILAPGSVEECFHLTRRAFDMAERFQGPVFILTDQFLADSYRSVEPFDVEAFEAVRPGGDREHVAAPYRRYAVTEDGVSPRLLPGLSEHLVVADSDEHTEDGHITEDLDVRVRMVDKRLRKGGGLLREVVAPARGGASSPELLLVSWGSSRGAVDEAAAMLREAGTTTGTLHFSQVWPLAPEQFLEDLQAAGRVICVEGNATGQFAGLIRGETGFAVNGKILRYDGLPLTPEYVLRALERMEQGG